MHSFTLHAPTSVAEALEALEQYGEDARLIAGGTALVLFMKQRLAQPEHLVSLRRVPGLDQLRVEEGNLRIGATTTQRAMETDTRVRQGWPVLAETYGHVASVRIRNMATVGGGIAHGDPSQDPPPTLIALGAQVRVTSRTGERLVPIEDFYAGYFETVLKPGEMVAEVIVPPLPAGSGAAFIKFLPRTADDYATVAAAALVQVDPDGTCRQARVGLGSVAPVPVRARKLEAALKGNKLTPQFLKEACAVVKEEVEPLDDFRGSAAYKRDMAAVIARRTLEQALGRAAR